MIFPLMLLIFNVLNNSLQICQGLLYIYKQEDCDSSCGKISSSNNEQLQYQEFMTVPCVLLNIVAS